MSSGATRAWRIATRRSSLARCQAQAVADALAELTGRPAELVALSTTGDAHPERAVEDFNAKGLFVDGVRRAVLDERCHLAVHSYKDLPSEPCPGLVVGAVPPREDPRDLLVTREGAGLASLRRGASVGTSSARRRAQLQRARRDLVVLPLRGNLDTRLRRVADGELDAVVVALAGVRRLGPIDLPLKAVPLEHGECLHAPAQGALAVECREEDGETRQALQLLDDSDTRLTVRAERALLFQLRGGCTAPIGAHAELRAQDEGPARLSLLGMVADPSGTHLFRASHEAAATAPELLGRTLAETLVEMGGREVLESLRGADVALPMGGP
ncbi:MAG: hydroxymethylbilane synthase [Actinomycetota bacterium]|nr:hydroxymethylbilane synthase [Actinomycetota bacterium]